MTAEIHAIVEQLAATGPSQDTRAAGEVIVRWSRDGRTRELVALVAAIDARLDGASPLGQRALQSASRYVLDVIALDGRPEHLEALFTLLARPAADRAAPPRPGLLRDLASRIASAYPSDALVARLARAPRGVHDEVLACWIHEAIARGAALDREPVAVSFQRALAEHGHPLSALPLTRLAIEELAPAYVVRYGGGPVTGAPPSGRAAAPLEPAPADRPAIPSATPIATDDALHARLVAAVAPWLTGSNGVAEAQVFGLAPPLGDAAPGDWLLRTLPLACVADGELTVQRSSPPDAWAILFSAAVGGGAYSSPLCGAYGRRAAWTSLGALVGAGPDEPVAEIAARAAGCAFLRFAASGGWWCEVAWDLGVLAVRAGGGSVAVLAATDTD